MQLLFNVRPFSSHGFFLSLAGNISNMNKMKIQLTNQLEDAKRQCDDEAKERQSLLGRYRNLEHEFDGTNVVYEEEVGAKQDAARQCQKAEDDANHWRRKVRFELRFSDASIYHSISIGRWTLFLMLLSVVVLLLLL